MRNYGSAGDQLAEAISPKFEHYQTGMQWKKGFMGIGSGWDQNQVAEIERLGNEGWELVTALSNPNGYTLFFKRQVQ